jgi:hypothetical protein
MDIELCTKCKGSAVFEDVDQHRQNTTFICEECHGTGRVYVIRKRFVFKIPFGVDKKYLYDADKSIIEKYHELIKQLGEIPVPKNIKIINKHRYEEYYNHDKYHKAPAAEIEAFYDGESD